MLKALHITGHKGTSLNINNIFNNLKINISLSTFFHNFGFYLNEKEANEIWQKNKNFFKKYDLIIITDTAICARPFFQNMDDHNLKIIVYLPMPFDCPNRHLAKMLSNSADDFKYIKCYREASNNSNVIFISDNKYHQYHAKIQGINFLLEDIIRPIPIITEINSRSNDKFFILSKRNYIENYANDLKGIKYEIFDHNNKFKNIIDLKEYSGMIHLPYQVNIMQLWENLGTNIIHFIPSKKFIKELIWNNDWYSWEEKYREPCLFEKSIDLSEWYQEENEDYFIYFNSWEDLKLKTKTTDFLKKKTIINNKIQNSNYINLKKWKAIINYLI